MANFYRSGAAAAALLPLPPKTLLTFPSSSSFFSSVNSFTFFNSNFPSSSPSPLTATISYNQSHPRHPFSSSRTIRLSQPILPRTVSMAAEITHPTIKGKLVFLPLPLSHSHPPCSPSPDLPFLLPGVCSASLPCAYLTCLKTAAACCYATAAPPAQQYT